MFNYTKCPICGGTTFAPFLTCKDHTVSQESFNIVQCESCSFKFTDPIPDHENLGVYYKSEDYISHSDTKKGIIARLYHFIRGITLKQKLRLVTSFVPRGTILDFGCGTGMFLDTCKKAGWASVGMEPDAGARAIGQKLGLEVFGSQAELARTGRVFDAITLWHVLEHVPDLDSAMLYFKASLKPSGVLIIAVPNNLSLDAQAYGSFWAAYDVPRHLYHFVPKTITDLFARSGFELVEQRGMKFDSFYVSMLSEKYRSGRVNYLKAFLSGFRSNMAARSSGNYSSLIYVFKPV